MRYCLLYCRFLYHKRVKRGTAYLQASRQRQANEYQNALYEGIATTGSGTGATAVAMSKHEEYAQTLPAEPFPFQPPPYEA